MNKKSCFTSRGYTYHLLDHIQFGDKYFDRAETFSSEYLLDCLNAGGVLSVREDDDFYFYISPMVTYDDLYQEVYLHLTEEFPHTKSISATEIITENLWILHTRKTKTVNLI